MVRITARAAAQLTGLPPKVVPCEPGREQAGGRAEREAGADRQAAAEALGQRDDVRLDAVGLVREPVPGAADAGLHLVEHQQRAGGGADLPGRGQVAGRRDDHAVLALDRLEDDHGGLARSRPPASAAGVAVRHVGDLARQRPERVRLGRLAGQRQRAHGAAVEAALGGHHVGAAGEPGQLERGLVGLRAGVAEQHPAGPAGQREQQLGERDRRLGDVEVGDVAEGARSAGRRPATTAGWAWPSALTAMPPSRSRYVRAVLAGEHRALAA